MKGERIRVNWKRLKPLVKREDLYPDYASYDANVVLMSKADRLVRRWRKTDSVRFIKPDPGDVSAASVLRLEARRCRCSHMTVPASKSSATEAKISANVGRTGCRRIA